MKTHSDPASRHDERPAEVSAGTTLAVGDRNRSETMWWKQALRQVAGAALRLHHYRYVRTRMFRDALSRDESCESHCVRTCGEHAANEH